MFSDFIGVVHNDVPPSKSNGSFFTSATGVDVVIVTGKLLTGGVSVTGCLAVILGGVSN